MSHSWQPHLGSDQFKGAMLSWRETNQRPTHPPFVPLAVSTNGRCLPFLFFRVFPCFQGPIFSAFFVVVDSWKTSFNFHESRPFHIQTIHVIYLHECLIFMVNVGTYTIHGFYGINIPNVFSQQFSVQQQSGLVDHRPLPALHAARWPWFSSPLLVI